MPKPASTRPAYKMLTCIYLCRTLLFFAPYADFLLQKNGLMKLGVIILGLSLLSTIGPTMGSFEGYIYTKIPYMYQMLGYPEAILYVLLFIGILYVSIKYAHRKIITLLSILIMALICFLGIMSFVMA